MRLVSLTQGKFTKIDDDDYEWLNKWKWTYGNNGYAYRGIYVEGQRVGSILLHQQLLPTHLTVDHKDLDKLNNQRGNLREATQSQQSMNCRKRSRNGTTTSKFKGVWFDSSRNKWYTYINTGKDREFLGRFESEIDAANAYNEAALRLHKEFAVLNDTTTI